MKKHLNKEFVMTKEDNEDFENSTKSWICDIDYVDNDVETRDYRQQKDCNINVKLKNKISVVFHNLKHDRYLMQELGKFNLQINVIPNGF